MPVRNQDHTAIVDLEILSRECNNRDPVLQLLLCPGNVVGEDDFDGEVLVVGHGVLKIFAATSRTLPESSAILLGVGLGEAAMEEGPGRGEAGIGVRGVAGWLARSLNLLLELSSFRVSSSSSSSRFALFSFCGTFDSASSKLK